MIVLLTAERGKVRAVAKGVSRGRSRLAAVVQPLSHGRYVLWQGRELDGISQGEIVRGSHLLTGDIATLTAAAYAAELVDAFWEDRQEAPEAFALLRDGLDHLASTPAADLSLPSFLRWFELAVLGRAGFAPELNDCAQCGRPLAADADGGAPRYVPERGGLCCGACVPAARPLAPSAVGWLRRLAGADLQRLPPPPSPPADREAALALLGHLTFVAGRPFKARAMLDALG